MPSFVEYMHIVEYMHHLEGPSPLLPDQKWTRLALTKVVWPTLGAGVIQFAKNGLVHYWKAEIRVEE